MRMARRRPTADENVVAMERDVDRPEVRLDAAPFGDESTQPLRERHTAGVDADECEALKLVVPLDQLVRQARERPRQRVRVENLARAVARR
jgi:hypothetical protein